ncbi:MAG: hypothetical protein WCT00_01360 [Bacilli bacterium]|jgi:hypothetical protein|nr:YwaF family protein [Acholeplasmataceae bacterium]
MFLTQQVVEIGNFYYFFYLCLFIVLSVGLSLILPNASPKTQRIVIASILGVNFALHFLKLLFPPYSEYFPISIKESSFQNICAVNTIIFPFIYWKKKEVLLDYMVYVGLISGVSAIFLPTEALGEAPFVFDTIRFYYCHMAVAIAPLLMVVTKIHRVNYHRIWKVPFVLLIVLCIIILNEVMMMELGFVSLRNGDLLHPNYRNPSLVFGPPKEIEGTALLKFILMWTPKVFMAIPVGEMAGQTKYWPILWVAFPLYVFFCLLSFFISLWLDPMHFVHDMQTAFNKLKVKWHKMLKIVEQEE